MVDNVVSRTIGIAPSDILMVKSFITPSGVEMVRIRTKPVSYYAIDAKLVSHLFEKETCAFYCRVYERRSSLGFVFTDMRVSAHRQRQTINDAQILTDVRRIDWPEPTIWIPSLPANLNRLVIVIDPGCDISFHDEIALRDQLQWHQSGLDVELSRVYGNKNQYIVPSECTKLYMVHRSQFQSQLSGMF